MKKMLFLITLLISASAFAKNTKDEWNGTVLTDTTIAKIQEARLRYKKCVSDEMQKSVYQTIDFRNATDEVMKQCEPVLAKIRDVYLEEKVPGVIADRHLKQMRIEVTRSALQNLMFLDAARKSGQQQ